MDLVSTNGTRIVAPLSLSVRVALKAGAVGAVFAVAAQAQSAPDAALTPFCTSGIAAGDSEALGLYEVGGGMLSADLVDAKAAQSCLKGTAANLTLNIDNTALNLAGGVQYVDFAGPQRRIVASTLDPVLCESYYTASDNLAFTLTNVNGDVQGPGSLLRGVSTMSYSVAGGQFTPALVQAANGPYIACASASTANPPLTPASADRVFGARFEDNVDLQIEYLNAQGARIDSLQQTINTNSVYKVRITNLGEAPAQGVRIREFVPKPAGSLTPNMDMGQPATCVRDSDGGSCEAPDGTLRQDIASLAPGASVTYTLTRRVNGSAAVPVAVGALTSVAAFVDPSQSADFNTRDNSRSLRIGLVTNGVPTATAQTLATAEDQPIAIVLAGSDPESSPLTFATANAQHGTLSGTAPNVTFTPAPDYSGPASFTFTVTDNMNGTSAPATITINVSAVNDAPRVSTALPDVTHAEGAFVEMLTASAFADPEGTALGYSATGLPPGLNISPSTGAIIGTLSLQASGSYNITVTATESAATGLSVSDTFVLTVSNTNQNPTVATPLPDRTDAEGTPVSVSVAANFADSDAGDTLTYSVSGGALPPGLSLAPNGQITGTLTAVAANGSPYTVTINANDGQGGSVTDTFAWTVTPVNFAPVAVGTLADRNGTEGVALSIAGTEIRAGFNDPDGESLGYSATNLPTGLTISGAFGTISGTPATGTAGTHAITVTATDEAGLEATQTFNLVIAAP